eukprot:12251332-Alexandrium_andersonii.AAC.1
MRQFACARVVLGVGVGGGLGRGVRGEGCGAWVAGRGVWEWSFEILVCWSSGQFQEGATTAAL